MGLQGLHFSLKTPHPQNLIDALYDEVYGEHDEMDEVDLALVINDHDRNDGEFAVVDYRVFRAGDQWFGDLEDDGELDVAAAMKDVDAWARSIPDSTGYFFVHKHPEQAKFASPKDYQINSILSSIDYARSVKREDGGRPRTYQLMVVVTRHFSIPIAPLDAPVPIMDREIDLAIHDEMVAGVKATYGIGDDHPWVVTANAVRDLVERKIICVENKDEEGFYAINDELDPLFTQLKLLTAELEGSDFEEMDRQAQRMAQKMLRQARGIPDNPDDVFSELMAALDELVEQIGGVESLGKSGVIELGPGGMVIHRDDEEPAPPEPLAPPTADPDGERPPMPEIFMLPEIQDDGTGFNWVG